MRFRIGGYHRLGGDQIMINGILESGVLKLRDMRNCPLRLTRAGTKTNQVYAIIGIEKGRSSIPFASQGEFVSIKVIGSSNQLPLAGDLLTV